MSPLRIRLPDVLRSLTANVMLRMPRAQQRRMMADARDVSMMLWAEHVTVPPDMPVTVTARLLTPETVTRRTDADAAALVAKPMLDGAVMAGVLVSDSPLHVAMVILLPSEPDPDVPPRHNSAEMWIDL